MQTQTRSHASWHIQDHTFPQINRHCFLSMKTWNGSNPTTASQWTLAQGDHSCIPGLHRYLCHVAAIKSCRGYCWVQFNPDSNITVTWVSVWASACINQFPWIQELSEPALLTMEWAIPGLFYKISQLCRKFYNLLSTDWNPDSSLMLG